MGNKSEIVTYKHEDLEVVGPYHIFDLGIYNNGWRDFVPLFKIKEKGGTEPSLWFLWPYEIDREKGLVKGYRELISTSTKINVGAERGLRDSEHFCSFQAKSDHSLVYSDKKGFEYIPEEDRQKRKDAAQERKIELVLDMHDRGVKGDKLYDALDEMWYINIGSVKAIMVRTMIAFAHMYDEDNEYSYEHVNAEDYYKECVKDMKSITQGRTDIIMNSYHRTVVAH